MKKTKKKNAAPVEDAEAEQIGRIRRFEEILDKATAALNAFRSASERLEAIIPEVDELAAYYESDEWKKDFADDEAGKLPADLKRGVLSEDGVYNLLEEMDAVRKKLRGGK
ncbi:MAG: DUF4298 domain-containing protein [Clostridia bacterium]|nr:DUF4298 domain-containing protein [Clostridia bacterium]